MSPHGVGWNLVKPSYFPNYAFSTFLIHVCWEPDRSCHVKWLTLLARTIKLQLISFCRALLTGETLIPVSLIALVPTILEKSVFYEYLNVASVSLQWPDDDDNEEISQLYSLTLLGKMKDGTRFGTIWWVIPQGNNRRESTKTWFVSFFHNWRHHDSSMWPLPLRVTQLLTKNITRGMHCIVGRA